MELTELGPKGYLGLYDLIKDEDFLEFSLLKTLNLGKEITLKKQLAWLVRNGFLEKVKRDLYVPKDSKVSEFKLAQIIFKGYIGLESALYLHKIIDILPFTITVMNKSLAKSYKFRNYTLKNKYTKSLYGTTFINGVLVSTKAKTLYDLLKYEPFDVAYFLNVINAFDANDLEEFLNYLKTDKSASLKQKVGYVFDSLELKTKNIKKLVDYCKKLVKSKVYIDKNGKYNSKWGVIVNG